MTGRRTTRVRGLLCAATLALVFSGESRAVAALGDSLTDADRAITAMEVERAQKLLGAMDASDPKVGYQLGRLAMETGDCDQAVFRLSPAAVQKADEDAGALLEVARGCSRAMAATAVVKDDAHEVVVRLQDDADAALVPLLGETIARQREVLEKDLGVIMPRPTLVDVVRDQFSLAAMTGLPHKSAQTTGTVAIAKFGRVILLSPRAPALGYAWRDTVAHELTHLALTRGTFDHAPLWLQEGVAKREEVRWRPPTPADDALPADAIAAAGLAKGVGRALDDIGPSIAMLPSAKEAMVVFAEVQSFVRFVAGDRAGQPGAPTATDVLPKLVAAYARGMDTDAALASVTGKDLKAWNAVWRPWVATRTAKLPASLGLDTGAGAPMSMAFDEQAAARAVRLGELLLGREHPAAAHTLLEPLAAHLLGDPLVAARIAYARFQVGDLAGAKAALDPSLVHGNLGAWWAVRADVLKALAAPAPDVLFAYETAVAHHPLLVEAACGWGDVLPVGDPSTVLAKGLCAAARARTSPKLGQD